MILLRVQPGVEAAQALTSIKLVACRFPGRHKLQLDIGGIRRLTLGSEWLYDASPACLAALAEFGEVLEPEGC